MYAEDMEWCRRMIQAGWKLHSVPQAIVEHHLSASTKQRKDAALISVTAGRSYFAYAEKSSRFKLLLYDIVCTCGNLLRTMVFYVRSLLDARNATMWRSRARLFARYARTHLALFGRHSNDDDSSGQ
jgi:GT2 family glycosyltransferase